MRITRTVTAAGLLVVEAGLGVFGVLVHLGLTAEYGDITDSAFEGLSAGFTSGVSGLALGIVALPGVAALVTSAKLWARLTAVAIPVLMVAGMYAVTPYALQEKLEIQYDATPQCVSLEDMGPGPGTRAMRDSQEAFASIEHVGHFGGGGGSGVGGCDRRFVLTEDVDVLEHYRGALGDAGWRIVEDDEQHLRAERDKMAFEVVPCDQGGVVWAGPVSVGRGARCDTSEDVSVPTG